MKITYLIGNGFDIACGLKTSYKDFIKYYIDPISTNPVINEFQRMISENMENWSDAEKALGIITDQYVGRPEDFRKCYDDFINQMNEYLNIQQRRINDLKIIDIRKTDFRTGVLSFYNKLPTKERLSLVDKIKAVPKGTNDGEVEVSFLVFNYTNVIERFLKQIINDGGIIGNTNHIMFNGSRLARFHEFEYVHGSLDNLPLVLGVNDEQQINNLDFKTDTRITRSFIKSESNKAMRELELQNCIRILDESNIICIYGMSLGETDKFWWDSIREWLLSKERTILLIFWWDPFCIKSSVGSCIESRERFQVVLHQNMGFSNDELTLVQDRIFYTINANVFNL